MKTETCTIRPSSYRPNYYEARVGGFTTGGRTIDEAKASVLDGYRGVVKFRVLETPEIETPYRHK